MNEKQWFAFDVNTKPKNREAVEYGLMEAGALGTETVDAGDEVRITGYFETPIDERRLHRALVEAWRLYNHVPGEIDRLVNNSRVVADRDWLAEWKQSWQPVQVGRFIVAAPWLSEPRATGPEPRAVASGSKRAAESAEGSHDPIATAPGSDTITIIINPGMAFGTGTHETTRLCLKAIDRHFRGGSFLDVGTGTGILAIAAAKMFPNARISACDTDAGAILIAKENARLNEVADGIEFHVGSVAEETRSADFICANLTAPAIVELLPLLLATSCGRLLLSGILNEQLNLVAARLRDLGAEAFEIEHDGDWVALVV